MVTRRSMLLGSAAALVADPAIAQAAPIPAPSLFKAGELSPALVNREAFAAWWRAQQAEIWRHIEDVTIFGNSTLRIDASEGLPKLTALGPQWRAPDDLVPRPDVVYHFEAYSSPLIVYGRSPMADALPVSQD